MKQLVLAIILVGSISEAKVTEVKLRSWAMVKPGPVMLSDFLEPHAPDELKKAYSQVSLGEAPGPDEKIVYRSQAISGALSKIEPHPAFRLVIPTKLTAEGRGLVSSLKNTKYLFEADLELKCFSLCRVDTTGWEPAKLLKSEDKSSYFEYSGLSMAQFPKKTFNQGLNLVRSSGEIQQVWIQGQINALMQVAVAKRFLQVGWRVEEQDIEIQEAEFGQTADTPISKDSLIGKKLAKNIGPGSIVTVAALEREFDVKFGQAVRGIIISETWKVAFEGTARDNGSIGDRIKIFNPTTKKLLSGILREKGVVEIK